VDRKGRLGVRLHPTDFSLRSSWSWSPAQLVRTDSVELVQAFPGVPALQVRQVLKPCPKGAKP